MGGQELRIRVSVSRAFVDGLACAIVSSKPHHITYHLKEKPLRNINIWRQRRLHNRDVRRDDTADHCGSAHGPEDLSWEQDEAAHRREGTGDHHAERDGGIEEAAADAVEHPCCDQEGEAVGEGDEDDGLVGVAAAWRGVGGECYGLGGWWF